MARGKPLVEWLRRIGVIALCISSVTGSAGADPMTAETIFGGGSTAATTFQHPTILKNVLGARIRVIPGYPPEIFRKAQEAIGR